MSTSTATDSDQVLEALESFVCEVDGERFVVQANTTRVHAGHKLARHYPTRFRPVDQGLAYSDESTAEDAPGRTEGRARTQRPQASRTRAEGTTTEKE